VVISTNVHVNKMTRWVEWKRGKYSGEERTTTEARYGGESNSSSNVSRWKC
jgi:hypothetical protein